MFIKKLITFINSKFFNWPYLRVRNKNQFLALKKAPSHFQFGKFITYFNSLCVRVLTIQHMHLKQLHISNIHLVGIITLYLNLYANIYLFLFSFFLFWFSVLHNSSSPTRFLFHLTIQTEKLLERNFRKLLIVDFLKKKIFRKLYLEKAFYKKTQFICPFSYF